MNTASSIEKAIATAIRENADLPDGVTIRCWQDLEHDATWTESEDRTFPMIEIRASPPRTDDNQSTLSIETIIIVGTQLADDKNHAVISDIYSRVQLVTDKLYAAFRTGVSNDAYVSFTDAMASETAGGTFNFGGFTYGAPLAPFEDRNAVMIGVNLITHYSRDDF